MSGRWAVNRLSTRLLLSHVAVALVGSAITFAVVRLLAPADFAVRTGMTGTGNGRGAGRVGGVGRGQELLAAFDAAVNRALLVGLLVALVAAVLLSWLVVRRLLRPLGRVRTATRALAQGEYGVRVGLPTEVELAGLAVDVNRLGEALQASETRRVRLIGEVAHEMRTPLTVIDGYVEGMIDGVFAPDVARLEAVAAETGVLRRLAEDLSALSRAEEGRLELVTAPVDLTAVVGAAIDRLRPQFEDAGVTLESTDADEVVVVADRVRIGQVVTNLLGNALRACGSGGSVRVGVRLDADRAVVEVRDDGRGLGAGDLERVFERFYRVPDPTGERRGTGSGIGLTISRSIARAHGGDLVAQSEGIGQGSSFRLVLPRA